MQESRAITASSHTTRNRRGRVQRNTTSRVCAPSLGATAGPTRPCASAPPGSGSAATRATAPPSRGGSVLSQPLGGGSGCDNCIRPVRALFTGVFGGVVTVKCIEAVFYSVGRLQGAGFRRLRGEGAPAWWSIFGTDAREHGPGLVNVSADYRTRPGRRASAAACPTPRPVLRGPPNDLSRPCRHPPCVIVVPVVVVVVAPIVIDRTLGLFGWLQAGGQDARRGECWDCPDHFAGQRRGRVRRETVELENLEAARASGTLSCRR